MRTKHTCFPLNCCQKSLLALAKRSLFGRSTFATTMSSPTDRLRSIDLNTALKSSMIALCRDLGLPSGGRKPQLVASLRTHRASLPPVATATHDPTGPTAITSASPAAQTPIAPTASTSTTLPMPTTVPQVSTAIQPPHLGASGAWPSANPLLQAYPYGSLHPGTLPLLTSQPGASLPVTLPPLDWEAHARGAMLPASFPPLAPQTHPWGAMLPPLAPQAHPSGAMLPTTLPPSVSQANPSGASPPSSSLTLPLPYHPTGTLNLQQIAQQAAQAAAEQAVAQVFTQSPSQAQGTGPLPSALHNLPQATIHTSAAAPTNTSWVYQPPAATTLTMSTLQTALAARAAAAGQPGPSSPLFAPLSGTIPTIPAKFTTAAASGEFVDFNELLHAIEVNSGEEPALCIQVAGGQQLSLPRKPKKKVINTFAEWVKCFAVYSTTLCAYQPQRGIDMLSYLYIMTAANQEFHFAACLAYDIAFRKKAANFRLSSWGHIDPQIYSKAFTGAGKIKASTLCSLCLSASHSTSECSLYSNGWPHEDSPLHNCTRDYTCSFHSCGGPHPQHTSPFLP